MVIACRLGGEDTSSLLPTAMQKVPPHRPRIQDIDTSNELRQWYWLKTELAAEARRLKLKSSGAKFAILDRICHYKDTGEPEKSTRAPATNRSKFDWHSETLTLSTRITNSYKNTQNVRRFFKANAAPNFKFNIAFMEWMKASEGKTLRDAVNFWLAQQKTPQKTKIKPHNQFNQYLRDFTEDNPSLGVAAARRAWAAKKMLPTKSGKHRYERSDLKLLKKG